MASAQPKSRTGQRRFKRVLVTIATSAVITLALIGALFQSPHPDPFRVTQSWDVFNLDWWRYPVEQNAFKRLPVVHGDLNSVFVLPGTQQVWAVGNGGLIVHSADGGKTWEQQRPAPVPPPAAASLLPALISTAHAVEPRAQQTPAQQPPDEFLNAPNPSIRNQAAPLEQVKRAPPTARAVVEKPAPTPRKEITAPLSGPAKGNLNLSGSANPQTQQRPEPTAPLISPPPDDATLEDIFFTDAKHGWAVGVEGTILATGDGGRSWQAQTSDTTAPLRAVHFTDATHGWAVGVEGTILATGDGGHSWQAQISGTTTWLDSVYFADTNHGWVVGDEGTILATGNGGHSWQAQTSGTTTWLDSVQFTDVNRGWVVGREGIILATGDGGRSWQAQTSGTTTWLDSVHFIDVNRGWAVGVGGAILATTDGGQSWQKQTSSTTAWLRSVYFTDANRGWVVGREGVTLATADGGNTWGDIVHYQRSPAPWVYAQLFPTLLLAAWAVRRRQPKAQSQANTGVAGVFVSDQPLKPGDVDHLGHGVVARGLADFIRHENTEPGLTVAVTGAWGLGKSSVMRLLEHALQSAGFRTAWFNAWHHQQEGRQLASMLNAIRRQAIPPVYYPMGLVLRVKLLLQRGWFYRIVLLLLLTLLVVAVCDLSLENQALQRIQSNAAFYLLDRKPTVLTQASLKQIEKDALTAPDALAFMRANMLWHPTQNKDSCLAKAGACVFDGHEQLLASLEQQLHRTLPAEERLSIANAAQHLPPPPLLTGLLALAGLASAVLLVFVGKGLTVFGFDISGLLGRFVPGKKAEIGKEAVGSLEHFRHEFGLITKTLQGRLVLFIDDLDRCDCATVREVLDMVNYLVSTGCCFVVLGVAMEHIECCIEPKSTTLAQDDYAKQYLKKLINIEVPVPTAPLARSRRMLEQQALGQRVAPGFDWRHWFGIIRAVAISAAVIYFGYLFSTQMPARPVEFHAAQATEAVAAASSTPPTPPAQTPNEKNLLNTRDTNVGVQAAPEMSRWPTLLLVALAMIVAVVIAAWSFVPHARVRAILEKLFKRAKLAAGGAERTFDSHDFVKALTAWHDVIALGDPTPRGLKRFVNRVRLFAMREQAARDEGEAPLDDATLVALAALHHLDEHFLDTILDMSDSVFAPRSFDDNAGIRKEAAEHMAIRESLMEHRDSAKLPWPPTPEQIARFSEISKGIYIR